MGVLDLRTLINELIPRPIYFTEKVGPIELLPFRAQKLTCWTNSSELAPYWPYFTQNWMAENPVNFEFQSLPSPDPRIQAVILTPDASAIKPALLETCNMFNNILESFRNTTIIQPFLTPKEDRELVEQEGYVISISGIGVIIAAGTAHGCFNGLQMVLQLFRAWIVEGLPDKRTSFLIFDYPQLAYRGFHLDLKDLMPTFEYVQSLITFIARYRVNYLLIEYEDKFPYSGSLKSIPTRLAWTFANLERITSICRAHFIEITPLIQVFGHVEKILLSNPYFKKLQEQSDGVPKNLNPYETWSLCPLHPDTDGVVSEMINQIANDHPESKYIHIGGDEVYQLGTCPRCREFLKSHTKSELYINYMNKIAKNVNEAGKIPIIWHDYLLKYPEALEKLDKRFIIMYWIYTHETGKGDSDQLGIISPVLPHFDYFQKLGFKVIGAPSTSANFDMFLPNYVTRLDNIIKHCVRSRQSHAYGVLITSWQGCFNPLETQKILLALAGGFMWSPPERWDPLPWRYCDKVIQRDLFHIPNTEHLVLCESVSRASERSRKLWPSSQAIDTLPRALDLLDQLLAKKIIQREILLAMRYGLEFRATIAEGIRILRNYYLPYTEAEGMTSFPSTDLIHEHIKILDGRVAAIKTLINRIVRFYVEESHQITPGEFEGLLKQPRYNVYSNFQTLGKMLQTVSEDLDAFILAAFREDYI
jgi:hypothetical protein